MSTSKSVQAGAVAVVPREAPKSLWSWDPITEMDRMLRSNALTPSFPSLGKPRIIDKHYWYALGGCACFMAHNHGKYVYFTCHVSTSLLIPHVI